MSKGKPAWPSANYPLEWIRLHSKGKEKGNKKQLKPGKNAKTCIKLLTIHKAQALSRNALPKLSIVDKMITVNTLLNQYKLKKHRHEQ